MIIRASLCGRQLHGTPLPHELFVQATEVAEKQTVTGLLVSTLMNPRNGVSLSKYDVAESWALYNSIKENNHYLNRQLVELCHLLQRNGIRFIVVKGATVAQLYLEPDLRVAGDIDFYLDSDNFERARKLISEEWGVEYEEEDDEDEAEQHIAFKRNNIAFEMHFRLLKFASGKIQKVFDKMIDGNTVAFREVDGVEVPILSPVEELVYTFLHLYHHFIEIGIGLRQICDMAVLLRNFPDDDTLRKSLSLWLGKLDFTKAFKAFEAICVDKLGVSEDILPISISEADRKYVPQILDVVFKRGNFGKYGRKTEVRSGMDYYLEAFKTKVSQYFRFYSLSPREARAVFFRDIPRKVLLAFRRKK